MKQIDQLNKNIILSLTDRKDFSVSVYSVLPSTNDLAKDLAKKGAKENTVIIAERQTAGRGRTGKSFFSPEDSGVYLSVILKPDVLPTEAYKITISAAVAAVMALKEIGVQADIKWVNDIFLGGKKVAGILTEASFSKNKLDFAVLGLGINFYPPIDGFPKDIELSAGYLFSKPAENRKNKFVAAFLNNFTDFSSEILSEYKRHCFILGKTVFVGDRKIPAKALDISERAELLVEYENGEKAFLNSGEISIKPIN